jgi:hypothetical protein
MPSNEKPLKPVMIEDARIIFRNFSGKETPFNAEGNRNFNVLIDNAEAEKMAADGWKIKYLKPREEGDEPQARLEVKVNFRGKNPPTVVMISSRGQTRLGAAECGILDWAEFEKVDLIINPYHWEVGDKTGIKAYLKSIFVTIVEDELEKKYADVPESAAHSLLTRDEYNFQDYEEDRS